MKLIGRYDSPYVRRVGVSLHVLGLPYEHLPLSPFSQAAELRRLAPIGRMPALVLDNGETLIESAAILDHLDEIVGPRSALLPGSGLDRRKALQTLAYASAACDKAIAINYERRRPTERVSDEWIDRCRLQLSAALSELEATQAHSSRSGTLRQTEITAACAYAYIARVEPTTLPSGRYPRLDRLSSMCEARSEFSTCPQ